MLSSGNEENENGGGGGEEYQKTTMTQTPKVNLFCFGKFYFPMDP